ncbi:MAG: LysM peptidoglycan-binding domain-containing protein [Alphaproteobacteria bacterium]
MEADNRYVSPRLEEFEKEVRGTLGGDIPVSRALFNKLDRESPTMELRNLFLEYKKYSPEEFDTALQSHIDAGANPYVLVYRYTAQRLFDDPRLMQKAIDTGIDFNLLNQAYDADLKNVATDHVSSAIYYQGTGIRAFSGFRTRWENYAQSQKVLMDAFPELKPDMDDLHSGDGSASTYQDHNQDYNTYMLHRGLMSAYERHGVFTVEETDKFLQGFSMHVSSDKDIGIETFHDEGFDIHRIGHAQYIVQEGDSLWAIAERYQPYTDFSNVRDIVDRISEDHKLDGGALKPGMVLDIPTSTGVHMITGTVIDGGTLTKGAYKLRDQLYNSQGNPFLDARAIAQLNNFDMNETIYPGDELIIPLKESFSSVAPLGLSREKDVTLAVIESGGSHHEKTFEIASKLAYHLSGDRTDNDVIAISTPQLGRIVQPEILKLYQSEAARNGEIIFSKSYAPQHGAVPSDRVEELYDKAERLYSEYDRQEFELMEQNQVINFAGIGNGYEIAPDLYAPTADAHAAKSVAVGAIHEQDGVPFIAAYSSIGADICAGPIHDVNGAPIRGTSFSTPDMAEQYHQIAKAYGGDLTHEEIMAAAYYSTDLRVKDFDIHKMPEVSEKNDKGHVNGHLKEGAVGSLPWARFQINAAGIPHHPRAGTGMIDVDRWIENLDRMKIIKDRTDNTSEEMKRQVQFKGIEPDIVREQGKDLYVYKVPIDADMTLGKMTLSIPQERGHRSTASIQGPSGTRLDMPYLNDAMYSTHIFAYENVSEGDVITVKTEEPFTDDADIIIRGHEAGNTIEAFRDYMIQNDLTQRPESIFQAQDTSVESPDQSLSVKVGV